MLLPLDPLLLEDAGGGGGGGAPPDVAGLVSPNCCSFRALFCLDVAKARFVIPVEEESRRLLR